jgi:hypothetical protein
MRVARDAWLGAQVIKRSVDSKNDVESHWFWLGLKYRYKGAGGEPSPALPIERVRELVASGTLVDSTPFQVRIPTARSRSVCRVSAASRCVVKYAARLNGPPL